MKCDELTPVTREYADEYWEDRFAMVYNADEVDAAIAELKRENERLNRQLEHVKNGDCINTCDVVEKHVKEELKAKRALWMARAERAKEMCKRLLIQGFDPKWEEVERKCRAKAKEYK